MLKPNIKTSKPIVPMIYAYTTPGVSYHDGYIKIGYTEQNVDERIRQQTHTAGIKAKKEWTGTAVFDDGSGETFKDHDFHAYLRQNDIEQPMDKGNEYFSPEDRNEWFYITPADSKSMFNDFRQNHGILEQKEAILQAQYQRSVKDHGIGHGITQRAEMNLLYQQKNIAGLEAQLRTLGNSLNAIPPKSNRAFSSISKGAGMARAGIGKLTEGYTLLNAKLAAFMAVAASGAGLFNITKDAMMAGNNLYKLQTRLNMTTGEAAELSRTFSLAGSDINSLTPFIARIDKQLLSAGASGNATSKALQKFGVTITDENGNLLQINEQLEQLAKGYRNAAEAGETEAFTAEILGARGAALIPVLESYNDLMAISKSIKTTGLLNPAEAHETYLEWQKMEMEVGQLKLALGAALLPVSRELLPEITEMFVSWIKLISDNKEEIKLMGEILIDVMHEAGKAIDLVASGLDAIGVNAKNVGEILRDIKAEFDAGYGMAVMAAMGSPANFPLIGALSLKGDVKEQRSKNDDAERSSKAEKEYFADIEKRTKARQKEVAQIKAQEQAEKKRLEDVAKAAKEMQESIYGLTHTELETQLHSIDKAMEKYKEAGVSEVELAKATEAQKAKVIKQFNDDVARSIDSWMKLTVKKKPGNKKDWTRSRQPNGRRSRSVSSNKKRLSICSKRITSTSSCIVRLWLGAEVWRKSRPMLCRPLWSSLERMPIFLLMPGPQERK